MAKVQNQLGYNFKDFEFKKLYSGAISMILDQINLQLPDKSLIYIFLLKIQYFWSFTGHNICCVNHTLPRMAKYEVI